MNRSASGKVAIVGVGESDIGKVPGMTGLGLNAQAAKRALDDAGLKVSDIDGVLTGILVHRAILHARIRSVRVPRSEASLQRVYYRRRRVARRDAEACGGGDPRG